MIKLVLENATQGNGDYSYNVASIIIAFVAVLVAVVSFFSAAREYKRSREASFFNMLFECTKPISMFIYDALLCIDQNVFVATTNIENAERDLNANFEYLYYYAAMDDLFYLEEFASLSFPNNSNSEYKKLRESMQFEHVFFFVEDAYITYRKRNVGKEITKEDIDLLHIYIRLFRKLYKLESTYAIKILYKKKGKAKRSDLNAYYDSLLEVYTQRYKDYLFKVRKKYIDNI